MYNLEQNNVIMKVRVCQGQCLNLIYLSQLLKELKKKQLKYSTVFTDKVKKETIGSTSLGAVPSDYPLLTGQNISVFQVLYSFIYKQGASTAH